MRRIRSTIRRGFTLLESLMAAGILLAVVVAVTSAIAAGQQHALEAHLRIAGAIAAEDLIGRTVADDYDTLSSKWNGFEEQPGTMKNLRNRDFPDTFAKIGRRMTVEESVRSIPGIGVRVHGLFVRVEAFDENDRTLASIWRFVPQPQIQTIPELSAPEENEGSDDSGGLIKKIVDGLGP